MYVNSSVLKLKDDEESRLDGEIENGLFLHRNLI
jgi:hypothetical protein